MIDPPLPVARDVASLRTATAAWWRAGQRIALVPTMGALHDGHIALVEAGRRAADRVVVSLFVNPKQFGPARILRAIRARRRRTANVSPLPASISSTRPAWRRCIPTASRPSVSLGGALTESLEGAWRPGHFTGVATVVLKLLLQTQPDIALFGEKDYQQLQVIRRMARDLDLAVEIAAVPTVRDAHGLALSSRNARLSEAELVVARWMNRMLADVAQQLRATPDAVDAVSAGAVSALIAAGFASVDYVAVVDARSLEPVARAAGACRILVAAHLGSVRLIDNLSLEL
ncbi:MAG: pantoate--beta-alanine ligase [Pseudomonadota bacterium]